ncbi:hypothetical protein RB594_004373, partial [Gaeumannomyces avenae]
MPPRRSHKKSRDGCRRCKSRKIKCDEVHPRCGNCMKHGVDCDFEHPGALRASSDGAPAASQRIGVPGAAVTGSSTSTTPLYRAPAAAGVLSHTTPATSRLLELRLMHHFISVTSGTLNIAAPVAEEVWRDAVPQIAFAAGSQHLADGILAVAALHLRSLNPRDQEVVRASHAYMASSLREYSDVLTRGINASNAESLFLTSTLIAIQSTATRVFTKDESIVVPHPADGSVARNRAALGVYGLPLSWFHSFQGVKAVTAASWQWLRHSSAVIPIINSQPVLQLDFNSTKPTFFGHLLDGLDQELAALPLDNHSRDSPFSSSSRAPDSDDAAATFVASAAATATGPSSSSGIGFGSQTQGLPGGGGGSSSSNSTRQTTRQAYEHAVAVLNWAHKIPHKGSPLAFPATVSRRFVELVEDRRPRALAILASFFALLKCLDQVWWLRGMARREVLGIVSLFNSDYFGPDVERQWWPHLEWSVRVALHDDRDNPGYVPADLWGASWVGDETAVAQENAPNFVSHIEMLSEMMTGIQSFPGPIPSQGSRL